MASMESPLRFPQARALLALDEAGGARGDIFESFVSHRLSPCHGFVSD